MDADEVLVIELGTDDYDVKVEPLDEAMFSCDKCRWGVHEKKNVS